MNRFFVFAIIINLALLGGFLYLDLVTWVVMIEQFESFTVSIEQYGRLANLWSATYSIFPPKVGISFGYYPNTPHMLGYAWVGTSTLNLALIWFIVTIIVNLSLIWYSGEKRMKESTKDSKTEPISSQKKDKPEVQK